MKANSQLLMLLGETYANLRLVQAEKEQLELEIAALQARLAAQPGAVSLDSMKITDLVPGEDEPDGST
jgi:hypothetical protein